MLTFLTSGPVLTWTALERKMSARFPGSERIRMAERRESMDERNVHNLTRVYDTSIALTKLNRALSISMKRPHLDVVMRRFNL